MRYAIISDIHANYFGFKKVLEDIENRSVDRFIFAGDYIFDLNRPNEAVDLLRSVKKSYIIAGNKEARLRKIHSNFESENEPQFATQYWTYDKLTKSNINFLKSLPHKLQINEGNKKILVTHSLDEEVLNDETRFFLRSSAFNKNFRPRGVDRETFLKEIRAVVNKYKYVFDKYEEDIIVFGHSHIQWYADLGNKIIINPGSVGLPLDYYEGYSYTLMDIVNNKISIEEIRIPFDFKEIISDMKNSSLYNYSPIWSELILNSVVKRVDFLWEFLNIARDIAIEEKEITYPLSEKILNMTYKKMMDEKIIEKI